MTATEGRSADVVTRLRGRLTRAARIHVGWPAFRRLPLAPLQRWHRVRRWIRPDRYTDAPAFAILEVDPRRIERSILTTAPRIPQWGRVEGGDWDEAWTPFDERPVSRAVVARDEEGVPWTETALREAFAAELARFGNAWGYGSMAGFERRCEEVETLYRRVRDEGYRRQDALVDRRSPTLVRLDEINVDVGRDGRLYWRCCGQHRLAIARQVGIDRVPVIVQRRHREWQAIRDRIRRGEVADVDANLRTHPDLARLSRRVTAS